SVWTIDSAAASSTFVIDGDSGIVTINQLDLTSSTTLMADLGLTIGVDTQAYDDELRDVASSTPTKGDLITSDGADWLDFAVGTDGYVLTASSTASNGLTWSNWTQISGVGTLLSGATGSGFTVNLDSSTLTCTNCLTGDYINSNIAGRSLTLTAGSPDTLDIDSEIFTRTKNITVLSPSSTSETNKVHLQLPTKSTLTRVSCHMDGSSSTTIQIDWRDQSTPNTAGTNTLSASLDCVETTASTTSFVAGASVIDARDFLNLQITDASTTADSGYLQVGIEHTVDD
ncbi:MAG TPA: hypothetical protein VJC15_03745, partial [Candidatus Paceibacterota bacterium]